MDELEKIFKEKGELPSLEQFYAMHPRTHKRKLKSQYEKAKEKIEKGDDVDLTERMQNIAKEEREGGNPSETVSSSPTSPPSPSNGQSVMDKDYNDLVIERRLFEAEVKRIVPMLRDETADQRTLSEGLLTSLDMALKLNKRLFGFVNKSMALAKSRRDVNGVVRETNKKAASILEEGVKE